MKRADYLRDLSSEHHLALRLVRSIRRCLVDNMERDAMIEEIRALFINELEAHFLTEEQLILPELSRLGESALVDRTLEEHRVLRQLVCELETDDVLRKFAETLEAHVRFEERTLFPVCQELFDETAIEAIEERMASHYTQN